MTLLPAAPGGSGHLTLKLQGNPAVPVITSANTTLELDPQETRSLNVLVSGAGSVKKSGPNVLNVGGANTYAGGTTIADGEIRVLGATAMLGTGNVSLTGDAILDLDDPGAVLGNVIDDTATLNLVLGTSVILESTLNEVVGGLVLNGLAQGAGTYGSTSSAATFQNDTYFSGSGIITVVPVPEPSSLLIVGAGLVALAGRGSRRRRV